MGFKMVYNITTENKNYEFVWVCPKCEHQNKHDIDWAILYGCTCCKCERDFKICFDLKISSITEIQ